MKPRRKARVVAFQALFEVDEAGHDPVASFERRMREQPVPESQRAFCRAIYHGTLRNLLPLDQAIHEIAPEWPLDQMAPVDRNILRLAAYELLADTSTPSKVTINEAVELAKLFGSDSSARFVNGVLGTLYTMRDQVASTLEVPSTAGAIAEHGAQGAVSGSEGE